MSDRAKKAEKAAERPDFSDERVGDVYALLRTGRIDWDLVVASKPDPSPKAAKRNNPAPL